MGLMRGASIFAALIFLFSIKLSAQSNQTFKNGDATPVINYPNTGCVYKWTNSNPAIGLPASGRGDIKSFTATNTTQKPITATITANLVYGYAYIGNYRANTLTVINTANNTVLNTMPIGQSPAGVAVKSDGSTVYVTGDNSGMISVISTATNTITGTISVTPNPSIMAISRDGSRVYVSDVKANLISIISTATNTVTGSIKTDSPVHMVLSPDGNTLYAINENPGTVTAINLADYSVISTTQLFGPFMTTSALVGDITISPDGKILYISIEGSNVNSGTVLVYDVQAKKALALVPVGEAPNSLSLNADGSLLYVSVQFGKTISIIKTSTNKVITTIPIPGQPGGMTLSPGGDRLYVEDFISNTLIAINTADNSIESTTPIGQNPISQGYFIAEPPGCGIPHSFTITVEPTPRVITATGIVQVLNTTYGTPSASGSFTVSGSNLVEGISVVPPGGFEVSLDNILFSPSLTIGTGGNISNTTVYIRLRSVTWAASYSAKIFLTSTEATEVDVPVDGTVNPAPVVVMAKNAIKFLGEPNPPLKLTYAGLQNNETPVSLPTQAIASTTATISSPLGFYSITASGATSPNYTFSYVDGTLEVASSLQIPNTFTPNNDGTNDTWKIKYIEAYPNVTVQVLNRYGSQVFFSRNYSADWDGNSNGAKLPAGTYYYIINPNDGHKAIAGAVTIIR